MAVAELGSISERRTALLVDARLNGGLPPFLAPASGVESGMMIYQYTAAALVSEHKVLAHPASVDCIPTSANQEDHVSMGSIAARHARQVLEGVERIVAIELLVAAQALDLRTAPAMAAEGTADARCRGGGGARRIRARVRHLDRDREPGPDIAAATELVHSGALVDLVGRRRGAPADGVSPAEDASGRRFGRVVAGPPRRDPSGTAPGAGSRRSPSSVRAGPRDAR